MEDSGESPLTSSFSSTNPTTVLVTHEISVSDPDQKRKFAEWSKKAFVALGGVEGWVRTRTYKCIDNLKTGTSIQGKGDGHDAQIMPKYLAVHGQPSSPFFISQDLVTDRYGMQNCFLDMPPNLPLSRMLSNKWVPVLWRFKLWKVGGGNSIELIRA